MLSPIVARLKTLQKPTLYRAAKKGRCTKAAGVLASQQSSTVDNPTDVNLKLSQCDKEIRECKADMDKRMNYLEQYDRRTNLRFFGIDEMENENTNEIILQIAECLDIPVYEIDISRSQRVGKYNPQTSTPRPIIVRFTSYRSRELFYENRKYLSKSDYYYITVREDLTRENLNLLRRCCGIEDSLTLIYDSATIKNLTNAHDYKKSLRALKMVFIFLLTSQLTAYIEENKNEESMLRHIIHEFETNFDIQDMRKEIRSNEILNEFQTWTMIIYILIIGRLVSMPKC
ncbi:unnamed protein product [Didymodactylos carnosus]|uniref:Uncharacterized protein n=1 Tax=Didymodactylos carnosus TaxID=1234261 RepID=A0A815SAP6_9BILA|nr:unnamed protein product [Didymodactylos carnosus]CAF1487233.1 unnamed protein product [Didymodactylos carnosus]CAF3980165.1 unnamed protein product [Didymodactylos carnosus]CAF4351007.1 unnamed protein product [Didymodactylos carnosus]